MNTEKKDNSYLQRLAALDMLRENMFFAQPNKLTAYSAVEDLPGVFRSAAPLIKNVLPSAAIISSDPDERRQQIKDALERIRSTKSSKSSLGKEILHNVTTLGLGSVPLGFMLSAAFHIASPRSPYSKGKWQSPIAPIRNVRRMLASRPYAKRIGTEALKDSMIGAGMSAAAGAAYPIFSHNVDLPDSALEDAAKVMQDEPQLTSLPPAELLSVMRGSPSSGVMNTLKNIGLGVGAGVGTGVLGGLATAGIKGLGYGARNVFNKFKNKSLDKNVLSRLSKGLMKDLQVTTALGAGLGAGAGAITKNLSDYDQQKADTYQT
jgi:hypothetical protein